MSLKVFHIFFIAVSLMLSLFLMFWGYHSYAASSAIWDATIIGVGALALLLLIPYGFWFQKKSKNLSAFLLLFLVSQLFSGTAQACAVCFGDPNSSMVQGIKSGIWVLIAVISGVLVAIASIAYSWHQRAKQLDC